MQLHFRMYVYFEVQTCFLIKRLLDSFSWNRNKSKRSDKNFVKGYVYVITTVIFHRPSWAWHYRVLWRTAFFWRRHTCQPSQKKRKVSCTLFVRRLFFPKILLFVGWISLLRLMETSETCMRDVLSFLFGHLERFIVVVRR